jgi:hypothetical protein
VLPLIMVTIALDIHVGRMALFIFLINSVLVTIAAVLVTPTYLAKFDNSVSSLRQLLNDYRKRKHVLLTQAEIRGTICM